MEFKKVVILLFISVLSIGINAQVEDGVTRSIATTSQFHDLGTIKGHTQYEIVIKNTGKHDLIVGEIFVPKGIGVTVLKRKIKPGDSGIVLVTIDSRFIEEGLFKKQIKITTYTVNDVGTRIAITKAYGIKGQVL